MENKEQVSVIDLHEMVDTKIKNFGEEFIKLVPATTDMDVFRTIIMSDLVAIREKAKLAINTCAYEQNRVKEES